MGIQVSAAATDLKLCSVASVRDRLGLAFDVTDAKVTVFVKAASAAIVAGVGRDLARQTYIESVMGNDRKRLFLSRFPVDRNSVTLTIDDAADTDFEVEEPNVGVLWREGCWPSSAISTGQDGAQNIDVTYKAGFVLPGWISDFAVSTAYTAGVWVRPSATVKDFLYEVTTAGTSTTSAPTWPTTAGGTVTNGTVVFTARHALELPDDLEEAALLTSCAWYSGGLDVMGNVSSERIGDMQIDYFSARDADTSALPRAARFLMEAYR